MYLTCKLMGSDKACENSSSVCLLCSGADPNNISVHALDLCDPHSVDGFTAWYRETHGNSLQVLVNNAGVHKNIFTPSTQPPLTRDGFEIHWCTNYLGTFHLTHALLPLLQQGGLESGDARVVNVVSHLHDRGKNKYLFEPAARGMNILMLARREELLQETTGRLASEYPVEIQTLVLDLADTELDDIIREATRELEVGVFEPRTISDGERHVLCSGFWGVSRHVNYLGEILMSCGLTLALGWPFTLVPWLYPLYYIVFLLPRERDDDRRCAEKYGPLWDKYRKQVPWRIVPRVY